MVAKERAHDYVFVRFVSALHHPRERTMYRAVDVIQRRKGEGRRVVEVARHQKPPGRFGSDGALRVSQSTEICGEGSGQLAGNRFVLGARWLRARKLRKPGGGDAAVRRRSCAC